VQLTPFIQHIVVDVDTEMNALVMNRLSHVCRATCFVVSSINVVVAAGATTLFLFVAC